MRSLNRRYEDASFDFSPLGDVNGGFATLYDIFLKANFFSHQLNEKKIMVKLCYLRLCLGIETASCRLFLRMERMDMD